LHNFAVGLWAVGLAACAVAGLREALGIDDELARLLVAADLARRAG